MDRYLPIIGEHLLFVLIIFFEVMFALPHS